MTEARQLGAGAHRAKYPTWLIRSRPPVSALSGDLGARLGQFEDAVGDVVLGQVRVVGAEGIGLHAVDANSEVGVVHRAHDIGAGDVQDLVAALVALEVLEAGILGLEHGAHGPVSDDNTTAQCFSKALSHS